MEKFSSHKKLLNALFQSASEGIIVVDEWGDIVMANPTCLQMFGYTDTELIGKPLEILISAELKHVHSRHRTGFFKEPKNRPMGEGRMLHGESAAGNIFPVEVSLSHMEVEGEKFAIGFVVDISERKKSELALQQEKAVAQRYLDVAASIFLVLDTAGKVVQINRKGTQIMGYSEGEMRGKEWFEHFLPDTEKERVREVFNKLIHENLMVVENFVNPVLTRDRGERLIEWQNALIQDEQGRAVTILSSGVDITEKRKAEKDLMQALIEGQEVERERIAKELHDGLGQSLTAMRLNLNALDIHCTEVGPDARALFEQLKILVYNTTQDVKSIAKNLMPGVLRNSGLVEGLTYLCNSLSDLNAVKVYFQAYQMDKKLDSTQSIGLYRIAQELLNNALKHGKASEINVQLIGHQNSIVLMVEDNGVGFEKNTSSKGNGLGLKNIETRVNALNGCSLIDTHASKGTSVTVEIPL
ncbi:PAS domain S-box-containing protein [Catalinimonas alkaloidigena]|uniref:PAS domain-containing sensor histidine kinase n=1 Tax=Catalinimonas alkaloidigena TaxID=1075417 RepID=UPI002405DC1B|nr:PAS domain S-box protein [Catalinimonas alkaloidigena]MDF9796537.1 PAS domain S-box-containing protein [Catalinimonas alkaloidigena]